MPRILWFPFFILSISVQAQQATDCQALMDKLYASWENIESMQYHSKKIERHIDKQDVAEFDFVIQRAPFKVAGQMSEKGHRILFDPSQNETEALYISNGFPYTNVWLNVHGKIFRGLNHYTISDAGCEFIFGIIGNEYQRIPDQFYCQEVTREGNPEWLIAAQTDEFQLKDYTAQKGETVLDIADKLSVSAYLLLERNKSLDEYDQDCGGMTIKVPSHYGRVVRLYLHHDHYMPTLIEIQDEKGVFERYEYTDYVINPKLPANYFTEDYLDSLE